ncbi:MAG TPA: exopolysaccharide biosynthesis polyprenyl glycosylphosphotransferase [Rhizomicrobium sp.]|nr:exopolysaccharide biosynthesis polyprenyl glycosylphosphotransferase [Rhizomicrobium sp.]
MRTTAVGIEQRFAETYADALRLPLAPLRARPAAAIDLALKRILDIGLSLALIAFIAPFLLLVALLIRIDSAGPALFRQTRLGLGGRPFDILKFRTMNVLENGNRVVQATRNDPRVTRLGRFLRQTSIDELPQLLNVLRGEMSLIGPRPHARAHDAYYGAVIDGYNERQQMKPGITGWAQVNGFRGETPTIDCMRDRVAHDLWYVRHFDFALDLKILALTLFEVARPRNAH